MRDPSVHQTLFRNYLSSYKKFELFKNMYLDQLNKINFGINVEISDKMCYLGLLFGVSLNI